MAESVCFTGESVGTIDGALHEGGMTRRRWRRKRTVSEVGRSSSLDVLVLSDRNGSRQVAKADERVGRSRSPCWANARRPVDSGNSAPMDSEPWVHVHEDGEAYDHGPAMCTDLEQVLAVFVDFARRGVWLRPIPYCTRRRATRWWWTAGVVPRPAPRTLHVPPRTGGPDQDYPDRDSAMADIGLG